MSFSEKSLLVAIGTIFIASCNSHVSNLSDGNFNLKSNTSSQPSSSPDPNYKAPNISDILSPSNIVETFSSKDSINSKKQPTFDELPSEETESLDGAITVIFKNNYKIRLDKITKKTESFIGTDISDLEKIFSDSDIISGYSLDIDKTDDELDKMQEEYKKNTGVDIPHVKSIHYYTFPSGTDTKILCKKLMALPFVRLAYPSPKFKPQATVSSPLNTSTPITQPNDIQSNYGWIKAHKVSEAWNYYGSYVGSVMPKIAMVDIGFLPSTSEINYIPNSAYDIGPTGTIISSQCANNTCVHVSSSPLGPHGHFTTAVAAGKRNNGLGTAGIASGAYILPLKVNITGAGSVPKAIYTAANDANDVDVICVVVSTNQPINQDVAVNTAISYASAKGPNTNGSYIGSRYKPVILPAGNSELSTNHSSPTNAIVVGGSMLSTTTNRYIRWNDSTTQGSNFYDPTKSGLNLINLSATAKGIYYLGEDGTTRLAGSGTSGAAPMVAATVGMMRKANPNITFDQLKEIVTYSATVEKSENGYGGTSTKLVGQDLQIGVNNLGIVAGVRNLNVLNALVIAKNLSNYQVLTRLYNIDDYLYLGNNTNSTLFGQTNVINYGDDKIFGINGLSYGYYINFSELNSSGGCAYGYQIYRPDYTYPMNFERSGGVSGVAGTTINCNSGVFNYTTQYSY